MNEILKLEEGKEILEFLGIKGEYEGIGNYILGYRDCKEPKVSLIKENYI